MSERTTGSTKRIELSVDRLENILNLLYADMFSILKESVSDLLKCAWSDFKSDIDFSEVAEQAKASIENLKTEIAEDMKAKISEISMKASKTDGREIERFMNYY